MSQSLPRIDQQLRFDLGPLFFQRNQLSKLLFRFDGTMQRQQRSSLLVSGHPAIRRMRGWDGRKTVHRSREPISREIPFREPGKDVDPISCTAISGLEPFTSVVKVASRHGWRKLIARQTARPAPPEGARTTNNDRSQQNSAPN